MKISLDELNALSTKALKKYDYTDDESAVILDMLMYA
jgi:LDH2 family malate/lactate/ureidoglycolate dehydrogenase